ncbi:MAG: hypothetical protein ABI391_07200 [Hyphomicrobiaceae bacterium]
MAIKQILTVVGGVLGSAVLIAGPAAAEGYGHGGYGGHYVEHKPAHVCYEHVTTPEIYGTVKKQVVVKEGSYETKEIAAITKIIDRKILVKEGEYETKTTPAVYETREKQVLIEPARTIYHVTPPVFKTERVSHPVETGYGHGQGYGQGHGHNAVLTYDKQVLVEPAKKHAEHKPAIYKTEQYTVLITPVQYTKIFHPPVYETKQEEVLIAPARHFKIFHPPVVEYQDEKVLIKAAYTFKRPIWKAYGEKC